MSLCVICGKSSTKKHLGLVHKKRSSLLLRACKVRGDDRRRKLLLGTDAVSVHIQCHNRYTNCRVLSRISRTRKLLRNVPPPQTSSSSSPIVEDFDFTKKCFICAETIPDDFETRNKDQGMIVHSVRSFTELKNVVLPYLESQCNQNSQEILERIGMVSGTDTTGVKYHRKCIAQLSNSSSKKLKRAHPCNGIDDAMDFIYSYLADSRNCLLKISDLIDQIDGDHRPDLSTVKLHLKEKYGDEIMVFDYQGGDAFVYLKETGSENLTHTLYEGRKENAKEARLDMVRNAAAIILEDIKSLPWQEGVYPPLDDFMQDVDSVVPESLKIFLSEVIMKQKRRMFDGWERKCTGIAHAIISAVRPKNFFSSVLMGVGGFFYKKFGSKHVIDILSTLGFCASYEELLTFELFCNPRDQPSVSDRGFYRLKSNIIDFDVNCITRHKTIHEIGEIHYVAPLEVGQPKHSAPRILKKQSKSASLGLTPVFPRDIPQSTSKPAPSTLVVNLDSLRPIVYNTLPTVDDFLWLLAKQSQVPNASEWNWFVKEKTNNNFITSKILCVNSSPAKNVTMHNALISAVEKCKAANQSSCLITLDLHQYIRAYKIIENADRTSPIKHVVLRLGGFHLIVSFLESIGYIMSGSGLEDLFRIIFRTENVKNIMSGYTFSKAIRGHVLTHLVLAKQIINSIELTGDERQEIASIIGDTERSAVLTPADRTIIQNIAAKFNDGSRKIEARGPTAKLWIQYCRMVTLVKQFIEAERSGNWDLHLDTMRRILPYFHASGKLRYAKAIYIYIQNMVNLRKKIPASEYHQFIQNGHYTIRRTHRFWSSIGYNVTIEQSLINTMKMTGVAGQGGGILDSVVEKWTMGLIFLQEVCKKVENYCGVSSNVNIKENVGMESPGFINEDSNIRKIDEWFADHPPFPRGTKLQSISTGIVGDSSINCHLSDEIGAGMMSRLLSLGFHHSTPMPTDRVRPLATLTNGITVDTVPMPIDPLFIFQRMIMSQKALKDLKTHLLYELAPYPLTLFTEKGMLKANNYSMYNCFAPLPNDCIQKFNMVEIVDGGYLLRCVKWDINVPFSEICEKYTKYVEENFSPNTTIIFDMHSDNVNDSGPENAGKSDEILLANIILQKEMICNISQAKFLANKGNKALFIGMLKTELEQIGCFVKQTNAHASTLMVHRAIQIAPKFNTVVIVSENVDILVVLTGLKRQSNNIYFRRPENGNIPEQMYKPESLEYGQVVRDNILFLHAFSGCKTTSAVYDMGKVKFLTTLSDNEELHAPVELFKKKTVDADAIAEAGERFFIALYRGSKYEPTINELRLKLFGMLAKRNRLSLTALPPTRSALRQHSFRTYHQVQTWLGVNHNPERWGWKKTSSGYEPIRNTMIPVPQNLLLLISCRCTNNCTTGCECRKSALKCSIICLNCNGRDCENQPNVIDILKDNDYDMDDEECKGINVRNVPEEYEVIEDRETEIEENQPTSSQYI